MLFPDRDDDQRGDECDGLGAGGAALRRGALVLRPPAALQVRDRKHTKYFYSNLKYFQRRDARRDPPVPGLQQGGGQVQVLTLVCPVSGT